jgi:hypothetical protein
MFALLLLTTISYSQITTFDHDKYWYYRWRLTNLFLREGETDYGCQDVLTSNIATGFSIPANSLERSDQNTFFHKSTPAASPCATPTARRWKRWKWFTCETTRSYSSSAPAT